MKHTGRYVILCLLVAAGCTSGGDWFGTTTTARTTTLVVNNGTEPETLDPGLMNGSIEGNIAFNLFEGLTRFDGTTLEPLPGVATNWTVSADRRSYTFHLRADAAWSDGRPLEAEDFRRSWLRVLDPATAARYASFLFLIVNAEAFNNGTIKDPALVGIRTLDRHTLRVDLVNPAPYFPAMTAFYVTLPVPGHCLDAHKTRWTDPRNIVSNGPFILESWQMHRQIVLVKNPRYHGRDRVRLEKIVFLPIEDTGTVLNLYRRGEIDVLFDVPLELYSWLRTKKDLTSHPGWGIYYYKFNINKAPLDNVLVRRALTLAVDRATLARDLLGQGQVPARSFTPPDPRGYRPPETAVYAPEEARRLLARAGYPGGKGFPRVRLLYNTIATDEHRHVAEVVQAMWRRELGINVELDVQEWKSYLKSVENMEFDIARAGWVGDFPDPVTFLDLFLQAGGNNNTGWTDPVYAGLVGQAIATGEPGARNALFHAAESILLENLPVLPLYFYAFNMLKKPYVRGIAGNSQDIHPLADAWLEPGR